MNRIVHVSTSVVLSVLSFIGGAIYMHGTEAPSPDPRVFQLRDQVREYQSMLRDKEVELLSVRGALDRLRRREMEKQAGGIPPQRLPEVGW